MSIRHHPGGETLVALAAGALDRAASAVIGAHLEHCPACRERLQLCEALGGALLAQVAPAAMAPDALARALASLDAPMPRGDGLRPPVSQDAGPPPRALAPGVPAPRSLNGLPAGRWRWLAPGVRRIVLLRQTPEHGRLYLLHLDPGVQVPQHGHEAWEATCVLAGSFTDEMGSFRPGDLIEVDSSHRHRPAAVGETACICLVAAAGRMRFSSPLARLLQPLVGV
jgi:putative transcriptional regulator